MNNEPAFPEIDTVYGSREILGTDSYKEGLITISRGGMTLRDYFAAQALTGMILNEHDFDFKDGKEAVAKLSYMIADAMLAERGNV